MYGLIDCVLCVMGKVDEKRLREQIQVHKKEKDEALAKMAELQKQVSPRKRNVVEFLLDKNKQTKHI